MIAKAVNLATDDCSGHFIRGWWSKLMTLVTFHAPSLVLPEVNELRFANRVYVALPWAVKTVNTDFHRTLVGDGIYLKCPRNEFSGHFAADVVLDALNGSLP
jgi:hypothetical protein